MSAEQKPQNGARLIGRWFLTFVGPALLAGLIAGLGAYTATREFLGRLDERTLGLQEDVKELRQADRELARRIEALKEK